MKEATKRISKILLVMAVLVCTFMVCPSSAYAAGAVETPAPTEIPEASNQGGLEVTTLTDKGSYQTGETAKLSVSVKNTNKYDLQDVEVNYAVPSNISVSGEKTQKIDKLAAGETKVFEVS
ncbi:MAG: hypothetical protein IIT65_02565, partial [Lachnospiraceae bacterium]|nr:hypothetical protein [Lachnospiraceae bacterium]